MEKDEEKLDRYQYEYFLKELETLSNYRAQFSNSRLVILGGSITVLSTVVTLTGQNFDERVVIAHFVIAGVLIAVDKMIASYSGAIYIFFDYIEHLENNIFKIAAFSHAWPKYLKNRNKYNATYACFIVCTVMTILALLYTVVPILHGFDKKDSFEVLSGYKCLYITAFTLFYLYLIIDIYYKIRPESIKKDVSSIRGKKVASSIKREVRDLFPPYRL